jgi:hypothetical protein
VGSIAFGINTAIAFGASEAIDPAPINHTARKIMKPLKDKTAEVHQQQVIHSYTRQEAIENGEQILASGELANIARSIGYKYPVYMTRGVFELVEKAVNNQKHCNDWNGVFSDLMTMSRHCARVISPSCNQFVCIITGTGRVKKHTFYLEVGAMDINDPEPVMTLMLPDDR